MEMTAIITAAGRGTRMAAITHGRSKELLYLGSQTVLELILEEARTAGVDRIIVVISREKPDIEAFLQPFPQVEIAYQERMRGVADAVAAAFVEDDTLIMMGDAVFKGEGPSRHLTEALDAMNGAIAVEVVDDELVSRYGICEVGAQDCLVRCILEKPKATDTKSRLAVSARYSLSKRLMVDLSERCRAAEIVGQQGEVTLTQILNLMIGNGARIFAVPLEPGDRRVDCGSPEEYEEARRMDWQ